MLLFFWSTTTCLYLFNEESWSLVADRFGVRQGQHRASRDEETTWSRRAGVDGVHDALPFGGGAVFGCAQEVAEALGLSVAAPTHERRLTLGGRRGVHDRWGVPRVAWVSSQI